MKLEYNTQRPGIILKEYGRNVQNLVDHIRSVPDKNKRTEMANTLIDLIRQLTPSLKDQPENPQRLWDDLYIIADFNLEVNGPYPKPEREILFKKPMKVSYPQSDIRFKHYGKNIEKLVKEAIKLEDPTEREEAAIYLGKLMKTFYASGNKETLDDSVIVKDIQILSQGKLVLSLEKVREDNLFEKLYRERKKPRPQGGGDNRGGDGRDRNRNQGGGGGRNFKRHNPHRRRDQ